MEKYCSAGQATDDSMANAHCLLGNKATNTPSECVIRIAFALQQWLHKRAPLLRHSTLNGLLRSATLTE